MLDMLHVADDRQRVSVIDTLGSRKVEDRGIRVADVEGDVRSTTRSTSVAVDPTLRSYLL
jgi:hypothetical protein